MGKQKLKGVAIPSEHEVDENLLYEEVSAEEVDAMIAQSEEEESQPAKKPSKPKTKKVQKVKEVEVEEVEEDEEDEEEETNVQKVEEIEVMKTKQDFLDEAKAYLGSVASFLSSFQYEQNLNRLSTQYNIPKQQIAQGFLTRIFAVISDVFGIVIETVRYSVKTVVNFISQALQSGTDLICNFALSLSRILTFNQGR